MHVYLYKRARTWFGRVLDPCYYLDLWGLQSDYYYCIYSRLSFHIRPQDLVWVQSSSNLVHLLADKYLSIDR